MGMNIDSPKPTTLKTSLGTQIDEWTQYDQDKERRYVQLLEEAKAVEAQGQDPLNAYMTAWAARPRRAEAIYYAIAWLESQGEQNQAEGLRELWRDIRVPPTDALMIEHDCYPARVEDALSKDQNPLWHPQDTTDGEG